MRGHVTKDKKINIPKLIEIVKDSNFFNLNKNVKINNSLLRQIILDTIEIPQKLKFYTSKQNIFNLESLLNTETRVLLRSRNIGERTIVKSRRVILNYINKTVTCFSNTNLLRYPVRFEDDSYYVGKYFPLLSGAYVTTQIYFNLISCNISLIKLPKRIKEYINNKKRIKFIYDLLHIDYDELCKQPKIGRMTIGKLQGELIDLLQLKKVLLSNI